MGELKLALTRTGRAVGGVQALVGDWNPENHPALRRLNLRIPRRRQGRALLLGTVPSMPFPKWEVAAWACEWVSSLFNERNAHSPERIYISRRSTKKRRLVNEAELEAQLSARGFKIIQPEQLSVAEQSSMFRRARCVVAPHGAGLTNLIFCPEGTHLIEIKAPQYYKPPCFQNLAAARGFAYSRITGNAGSNTEFDVNIAEILKLV